MKDTVKRAKSSRRQSNSLTPAEARTPHVPSARPSSTGLALPAEDGRLWRGGKRAGWNRGYDLATGAALNRAARDGETRRRLAAGESVRAVARALRCGLATVQLARAAG